MKLQEGIDYYIASDNEKEVRYAHFLIASRNEIGEEELEDLFVSAESNGKFLSIKYEDGVDDGGEYILVDSLP